MGTSRESSVRILRVAGFDPLMSVYESGVLARIIWRYVSGNPCTTDTLADLETPIALVSKAVDLLIARGVVEQREGRLYPVKYMEWEESDERRREALEAYNKRRVADAVSRIEGLNLDIVQKFNIFWKAYPRPKNRIWHKSLALRAFVGALKVAPLERILEGLEIAKRTEQWRKDGGQFIPMPSTFLNQRRWEDYINNKDNVAVSRQEANIRTIQIAGKVYTAFDPPRREQFHTDEEYLKARNKWAVWLSSMS